MPENSLENLCALFNETYLNDMPIFSHKGTYRWGKKLGDQAVKIAEQKNVAPASIGEILEKLSRVFNKVQNAGCLFPSGEETRLREEAVTSLTAGIAQITALQNR